MALQSKFSDDEKVLCINEPLIYEAKCLKSSMTEDECIKYLIHYEGWDENWDEWVSESRVLKYNEENLQRQKDVQQAHSAQAEKIGRTPAEVCKIETGAGATPAIEESTASTSAAPAEVCKIEKGAGAIPAREESTASTSAGAVCS